MDFSGKTIMIVEDSDVNTMFFQSAFKHTGANIIIARNGEEAIEQVKNTPDIDLILMDIRMPKIDGLEATRVIKKLNHNITIIVQTAYVLDYNENKSYEAGCDYFLEKPIRLPQLYAIAKEVFE
jgi:CheY-like chemotaxis protein